MSGWTLVQLAVPAALLLDRMVGDPPWLWARAPHPVVLIGAAIEHLDRWLNRPGNSPRLRRCKGALAVTALILASLVIGELIHAALHPFAFGWALEAALASVLLAQKSLTDHVSAVARALAHDGVQGGREAVSLIVGRDVTTLDEAGVARAAIESAAENFSDGVVAPVFWFLLLGLPGLIIYKAVNTADSMIGHRSPRHEAFGWAAARLDDLLNLVPSRLAVILLAGAASFTGADARQAVRSALQDAPKHRSPNAGWPEAAVAGALGVALGGPRRYGELSIDGAWLNDQGRRDPGIREIVATVRLINAAWTILFALACFIALAPAL